MCMKKQKRGRRIAASLGPGDPDLITRKAWQFRKNSPCWAWPITRKGASSYALDIVRRGGLTPPDGSMALDFPMTRDIVRLTSCWHAAAQFIKKRLDKGDDVVFLVEGDASTFATFGEVAFATTSTRCGSNPAGSCSLPSIFWKYRNRNFSTDDSSPTVSCSRE